MKWLMRMLDKAKKERHGFTLIELMIVLVIIAILAVAAVPTYRYFVDRAYESEANAALGAMKTAQIVYRAENATYAGSWSDLGMTSSDFTDNRWWAYDAFQVTTGSGFPLYADGDSDLSDDKVDGMWLQLNATGDIIRLTAAPTTGTPCPAGP